MLTHLGCNSLENKRNELRLQMLYKIINQLVDIDTDGLLQRRPQHHSKRGHSQRFLQLPTRINAYYNSFFPKSIKVMEFFCHTFNLFKQTINWTKFY